MSCFTNDYVQVDDSDTKLPSFRTWKTSFNSYVSQLLNGLYMMVRFCSLCNTY